MKRTGGGDSAVCPETREDWRHVDPSALRRTTGPKTSPSSCEDKDTVVLRPWSHAPGVAGLSPGPARGFREREVVGNLVFCLSESGARRGFSTVFLERSGCRKQVLVSWTEPAPSELYSAEVCFIGFTLKHDLLSV